MSGSAALGVTNNNVSSLDNSIACDIGSVSTQIVLNKIRQSIETRDSGPATCLIFAYTKIQMRAIAIEDGLCAGIPSIRL